jgi:hypothetical protein
VIKIKQQHPCEAYTLMNCFSCRPSKSAVKDVRINMAISAAIVCKIVSTYNCSTFLCSSLSTVWFCMNLSIPYDHLIMKVINVKLSNSKLYFSTNHNVGACIEFFVGVLILKACVTN